MEAVLSWAINSIFSNGADYVGGLKKNSDWYLAELVMEITIAQARKNVVHRNLTLIEATSPKQAYAKAMRLGRHAQTTYENPAGRRVRHKFLGLSRLEHILCGIGDGAEIGFQEDIGIASREIEKWIPPMGELAVFRPQKPRDDPETNYASRAVLTLIERRKLSVQGGLKRSRKERKREKRTGDI